MNLKPPQPLPKQMTESTFIPAHLLSLLPNDSDSFQDYQNICDYCGVDWTGRFIRVPADDFHESLNQDQVKSLRTFQNNLLHFFEHFDAVMQSTTINLTIGFNIIGSTLINGIRKDLEEKGWLVFQKMTRNFIDQLRQHSTLESDSNPQPRESQSFNDVIVDNLCDGDLDKALKLVPSRELARQLGVSDQKLRREIYLARQRALKKRPFPKKSKSGGSDDESDHDDVKIPFFTFDINQDNIPTCASPISSTSSSDFDHFQLIETPLEGWQSWLNIDMIEN